MFVLFFRAFRVFRGQISFPSTWKPQDQDDAEHDRGDKKEDEFLLNRRHSPVFREW